MDPREDRTFSAALRHFKSQLREHICVCKTRPGSVWEYLSEIEKAIQSEAIAEWSMALAEWDLDRAESRLKLRSIIGEAFYQAVRDVASAFESENVADILNQYVAEHNPMTFHISGEGGGFNAAG